MGTTGVGPFGITIDSLGNIYTANSGSNNVSKITPAGVSTILGATGTAPIGITIDSSGNIYTANQGSDDVSKITPTGESVILGPTGDAPTGITIDSAGNIYTTNVLSNNVTKIISAPFASDEAAIAAAAKAAAAAAAAKREAEVKAARADISNKLAKSEKLTLDNFKQAEIAGVTADNFASVQAEILALPAESRSEISQVLKVARKYEVIGKVATGQISTLPITAFVEVGLIPTENKHKTALIAAVRRASTDDRDSYAEIQAVIAAEAASIKARKERLAALISRNNSRKVR